MGNSTTTIAISTDRTNYFSSIITAEHGVNVNTIHVKISGKEISIINKDNSSEMLNWEFFCAQHSLSTINNDNTFHGDGRGGCCVLNAGHYEIPFQFLLPAGLPTTMYCKNEFTTPSDKVLKYEIKYEIKASSLLRTPSSYQILHLIPRKEKEMSVYATLNSLNHSTPSQTHHGAFSSP